MEEEILSIVAEESGERIDALLARMIPDLSRSAAQRLIEQGAVLLEGRPIQKNTRCQAGESITIVLPETEEVDLVPQDLPLDIVYEDADLIVVNKARGMVVHPAPGHRRREAARHRPPHRQRYLRPSDRCEKRLRAPGAFGSAGRPQSFPRL